MKMLLPALLTIWCMSLPDPAQAAHPLATDDTGTQGVMKFQMESSAEFGWDTENKRGITTRSDYQKLTVAATAGVLESLDLQVSYPYTWQKIEENGNDRIDNSGLNDLAMALKWRFLELGPASFAIKPSIAFPTANRDRNLGSGRAGYGATLISTVEFKPVAIHTNIGYTNQKFTDADKDGSREHLWNVSLAGVVEILKGLQLVAEAGTTTNPDKGNSAWPVYLAGGVIFSVLENLDLDVGAKGSLTAPETDLALSSGITFKFP